MNNAVFAARRPLSAIVCLWLVTACGKPEPTPVATTSENAVDRTEQKAAQRPSVDAVAANPPRASADNSAPVSPKAGSSDSIATTTNDRAIRVEKIDLNAIVKAMLSRELFKLDPARVQAYFDSIAALQPLPADETWLRRFQGPSKLPMLQGVLIELQEEDGRWRLGQSQMTWRPPKDQALSLYERLVAEVKGARGRKADFGEDESEGGKHQRYIGWTWCKDRCQALVALDSDGHMSLDQTSSIDEDHPAVLLQVFTPEGP